MSTSERMVLAESAGAAALVVGLVALASPDDVWLRGYPLHPMWIAVTVMAARYAARGLVPALVFCLGGLTLTSLALGGSVSGLAVHAQSSPDLLALTVAVLVAWIAMLHEGRIARANLRLSDATSAHKQAEENLHALHESLAYLRSRHDRLDVSLSLWRNLAGRLERGDSIEAAKAVLELSEIRAGARAGVVQLRDGNRLMTLACRGQWSASSARPADIDIDQTVRAAILTRQVTPAGPGSTENDSDVAVPVTDEDSGVVIGVIALRGMSPSALRAADLRDLGVLGQWLAPALARSLQATQLRRKTGKSGEITA